LRYIKKIGDYSIVGGMSAFLVISLVGCESSVEQSNFKDGAFGQASIKEGAFVVIEEISKGQYKIVDEHPSSKTTIILRKQDGSEKILSKEELDKLVKDEAAKIDNGTSRLTESSVSSGVGGMSLGETILASMAGAIIGSWIGSKLFNNQNYQNNRQASYKNPSTYTRSKESFNQARKANARKQGSFSKKSSSTTSRRGGSFFKKSGGSRRFGG
jgi:hypothetical protein